MKMLDELLQSSLFLVLAYLLARVASFMLCRLLLRRSRRSAEAKGKALVQSLAQPVTWALFLLGTSLAVLELPGPEAWRERLLRVALAGCLAATTVAGMRGLRLLLVFWARDVESGEEKPWARDFAPLLSKVGRVLIAALGLLAGLKSLGVDVNSLIVSLGVGSLAVGLAAQDTLANMFAGFTLLLDRPFRLADRIRLSTGEVGDVEAIGLRATRLKTLDEAVLVIPNSLLTRDKVVNLSLPDRSLTTRLEVAVAYGTDLREAKRVLALAGRDCPRVDPERPPLVLVTGFADFAISLRLIFWVKDYAEQGLAASEVYERVYQGLQEAGIEIPFPVRRIIQGVEPPAAAGA